MQLNFDAFYVLLTQPIVALHCDACLISRIIRVLVEHTERGAGALICDAHCSLEMMRHGDFKWSLYVGLRLEDKHLLLACADIQGSIGYADLVSNCHAAVLLCMEHRGWQPVWHLQAERVSEHTNGRFLFCELS